MTRGDTRWNLLQILLATVTVVAVTLPLPIATAFDVSRMIPVADRSIRTGNKMLIEKEVIEERQPVVGVNGNEQQMTKAVIEDDDDDDDGVLDVNELPVRYDEAQLWRIYNISEAAMSRRKMMPLADILESKYGKCNPEVDEDGFDDRIAWKLIFHRVFRFQSFSFKVAPFGRRIRNF